MFTQIYVSQWMSLPRDVRVWLRTMFDIPQTNVVEVLNNTVITDGVTNDDLKAITLEKLQEFTKQEGKFSDLFEYLVQKIQLEIGLKNGSIEPKKKDWSRYCQECDSKGGRHLRVCPNFK